MIKLQSSLSILRYHMSENVYTEKLSRLVQTQLRLVALGRGPGWGTAQGKENG